VTSPQLNQVNTPTWNNQMSNSTKLWSFPNSTCKFSNLWHLCNWNFFSCDKSIIESSKRPNSKQPNKSNSTKLWSFLNSTNKFHNFWDLHNWNFLIYDKSIIESSKNTPTWNKQISRVPPSFKVSQTSLINSPICGTPTIETFWIVTSPQLNQVNTPTRNNETSLIPLNFEVSQTSLATSPICGTHVVGMFGVVTSP
jgi:hypothetical protein